MSNDEKKIRELEESKAKLDKLEGEYEDLQLKLKPITETLEAERKKFANLYGEIVYKNLPQYVDYGIVGDEDETYRFCQVKHGRAKNEQRQ